MMRMKIMQKDVLRIRKKKKSTPADSNILDTEVVVPLLKYLGKF